MALSAPGDPQVDRPDLATRSVALVGFMGVGKSSVGRELARLLDRDFVDTDDEIVARSGRTIPELFAAGEPAFRSLERRCVLAALDRPPGVIALGGGAFSQPGLADIVLERALVVHLQLGWSEIVPLLPELAATRPLIASRTEAEVERLFLARAASYRRAHICVPVHRGGVAAAALEVATALAVHGRSPGAGGANGTGGSTA